MPKSLRVSTQRKGETAQVLADVSNASARRSRWSTPAMPEFVGSSAVNPWVLNPEGELVLQKSAPTSATTSASAPPKPKKRNPFAVYKGIIGGPPSSIRQSPPREPSRIFPTLSALEADAARVRVHRIMRAAREHAEAQILDEPRPSRIIRVIGDTSSSAATTLVVRTSAEQAMQELNF
ncbi:hypothetical protein C8R45DRAFT_920652 [Mycena sanguinolenta]|nr:hypothetical protein C8R45DRAFT_920652 [Mycena sanguinolenta]